MENSTEGKKPVGRPLKFQSVQELQDRIEMYFEECRNRKKAVWNEKLCAEVLVKDPRPLTITGLAVALDTDRDTLLRYEEKDEFCDTIKRAKEIIHNFAEESLWEAKNAAGIIFNLKNNWTWKDKTETEQSGEITMKWEQ